MNLSFFYGSAKRNPYADWGLLLLRVGVSLLMLTHGYPKLQNLLNGAVDFPDPLHVTPKVSLALVVLAEFGCSLLLIAGYFTRFALYLLIVTMLFAAFYIHASDPLDVKEHALLFLLPYASLLLTGPGKFSLDSYLSDKQ